MDDEPHPRGDTRGRVHQEGDQTLHKVRAASAQHLNARLLGKSFGDICLDVTVREGLQLQASTVTERIPKYVVRRT
jgi:hypothetical protein